MKKIIYFVAFICLTMLSVTSTARAFDPNQQICQAASGSQAANSSACQSSGSTGDPIFGSSGILATIIDIFSAVVAAVSVIMIIIAGFEYVTSGGDSQKTSKAKDTLIYAIVGIAVVAVAQILVLFVISNLHSS